MNSSWPNSPAFAACAIIMLALASNARAQQYTSSDWSELRRRVSGNSATRGLLRYETVSPAARPTMVAKLEPPRVPAPASIESHTYTSRGSFTSTLTDRQRAVVHHACENQVPPAMALAIIHKESLFGPVEIIGQAGELGPGQILPRTAYKYGFDLPRLASDWDYNVACSTFIMRDLLNEFPEQQAISAYNGGRGYQNSSWEAREKVRRYTDGVLSLKRKYDGLQCQAE